MIIRIERADRNGGYINVHFSYRNTGLLLAVIDADGEVTEETSADTLNHQTLTR